MPHGAIKSLPGATGNSASRQLPIQEHASMKTPSMMDQNLLSATGANSNKNDESNQRLSNSAVNKSEESKA